MQGRKKVMEVMACRTKRLAFPFFVGFFIRLSMIYASTHADKMKKKQRHMHCS